MGQQCSLVKLNNISKILISQFTLTFLNPAFLLNNMDKGFLPTSLDEGKKYYKNFKEFDVVFVTGDPYYDHPLSGMSIIARLLDKKGYKVGILPRQYQTKITKFAESQNIFSASHQDCWTQCSQITLRC